MPETKFAKSVSWAKRQIGLALKRGPVLLIFTGKHGSVHYYCTNRRMPVTSFEHKTTGILRAVQSTKDASLWWLYAECCPDIGRYYRSLLRWTPYCRLMPPKWGEHVTIIRREPTPPIVGLDGQEIEFEYSHGLIGNEKHLWLAVRSERMMDLREQYGLPRQPYYNFHLTIGVMPGNLDGCKTLCRCFGDRYRGSQGADIVGRRAVY